MMVDQAIYRGHVYRDGEMSELQFQTGSTVLEHKYLKYLCHQVLRLSVVHWTKYILIR